MSQYYTAEYSVSQNCFHVDTLQRVLRLNQVNALGQRSVDYQIIAICISEDEAMDICRKFREKLARKY